MNLQRETWSKGSPRSSIVVPDKVLLNDGFDRECEQHLLKLGLSAKSASLTSKRESVTTSLKSRKQSCTSKKSRRDSDMGSLVFQNKVRYNY